MKPRTYFVEPSPDPAGGLQPWFRIMAVSKAGQLAVEYDFLSWDAADSVCTGLMHR